MQAPKSIAASCLAVLGLVSMELSAPAEDYGLLQQTHAWGRFGKGSWRQVRILTESFDDHGTLTNSSTTDNKTTIEEVTPERVTLKIEVTVEIAGQKFPSQPQIIKQGYAGENVGQSVSIKPLSQEVLIVDDREIPCQTQQIEILGGASKEVSLISYSPRVTPSILKRKSTTSEVASARTTQETVSEVYALDMPFKVLGEIRSAYSMRLVQKNNRGTTTTWSVHVHDVPGEVVAHSSKKLDSQGRLVRRSTLELVAYGVEGDDSFRDGGRRVRRYKRGRESR
ncbi:MAG: hypothetical protein HY288_12085 [Planctomycetia bacterium]|nr:hypothetical protein [Planctomycetia bacterium]